jgi:5-methylcytosine-specific restriction endonuclease McrA
MKLKAVAYKGGKCISCGFNKYIAAMEFHHLDSKQKDFSLSGMTISWVRMQKELDKCALLCANCHRAAHSGELVFQSE